MPVTRLRTMTSIFGQKGRRTQPDTGRKPTKTADLVSQQLISTNQATYAACIYSATIPVADFTIQPKI